MTNNAVFIFTILILSQYVIIILTFYIGLFKLKNSNQVSQNQYFSIIVPFRNEAENLVEICNSFQKINYPIDRFECIFVNDQSEDDSEQILSEALKNCNFDFQIIQSKGGKKAAISKGVTYSVNPIIVCTDADCFVSENWLSSLSAFFDIPRIQLVLGSVLFTNENGLLSRIFSTEFAGLLASTAGSCGIKNSIMANGANISFRKSIYTELQEKIINSEFASGDDTFLMSLCKKKFGKDSIAFNFQPKAVVFTNPPLSLRAFLQQRLRWASKSLYSSDFFVNYTAVIVFLSNLLLLGLLFYSLFFCSKIYFLLFPAFFLLKTTVDYVLIRKYLTNYGQKSNFLFVLFLQIMYPFYVIIVAVLSPFVKVKWKGRPIKY